MNLKPLFQILNLKPKNEELYKTAFTHSSYASTNRVESYENLEFFGDSVVYLAISNFLFKHKEILKKENPNFFSLNHSFFRSNNTLMYLGKKLKFKKYININCPFPKKKPIEADVFESLMAAIYLDYGMGKVQKIFNQIISTNLETLIKMRNDFVKNNLEQAKKHQLEQKQIKQPFTKIQQEANINILKNYNLIGNKQNEK